MKQDISNEIEKIISYCKSKECDECKYKANDDLCNLHNPTAWNVINEKQTIEKLKQIVVQCKSSKECWENESCNDCYIEVEDVLAIETVLNLIEKQDKIINLMAEQMTGLTIFDIEKDEPLILGNKQDVIEYFTQKIEKGE